MKPSGCPGCQVSTISDSSTRILAHTAIKRTPAFTEVSSPLLPWYFTLGVWLDAEDHTLSQSYTGKGLYKDMNLHLPQSCSLPGGTRLQSNHTALVGTPVLQPHAPQGPDLQQPHPLFHYTSAGPDGPPSNCQVSRIHPKRIIQ